MSEKFIFSLSFKDSPRLLGDNKTHGLLVKHNASKVFTEEKMLNLRLKC